jgi:Family of unknown function (DUF6535)
VDDSFQPSSSIVAINAMLFSSLILSLLGALGAMVVKQWIRHYETYGTSSSLLWQRMRRRTRIRMAMENWHLDKVITCIPYMLHVALAIFLVAVLMWTYTLDTRTMIPSTVVVLMGTFAYVLLTFASVLPHEDDVPRDGGFSNFRALWRTQLHQDIERSADAPTVKDQNVATQPRTFILNQSTGLKARIQQLQPPVPHIADAVTWINAIKDNEGHEQTCHAFYRLRTENWGQLKLDGLLMQNGKFILVRCSSVANELWVEESGESYLVEGAREQARAICLFIEWFYHQLSVDQRRSLNGWPDARVAKSLMYDPWGGRRVPSNAKADPMIVDDITLGSSVLAKLHHVQLAQGAVCEMCIIKHERDNEDVRVRIPTAKDPQVYGENDPPHFRFPWKKKMQELVSACISSDADCLFHYAGGPHDEDWKGRINASQKVLSRCITAHIGMFPHESSYVPLREMLGSLRGIVERDDARREWIDQLYKQADATRH